MPYSKPSKAALRSLLSRHFPAASAAAIFSSPGGLSGSAWRVNAGGRDLIARVSPPGAQNGVTLSRLYRALKRMPDTLAPRAHFLDSGWLVTDYLPGEVKPALAPVPQLASLLYHLHHQRRFGWRLHLLPLLEEYWQHSDPARRTVRWLRALKRLRRLGEPRPLRLAPLHMDVHAGNLVHHNGGLRLIDWEYAGDGDVALELAAVWLADNEREALIHAYAREAAISPVALGHQVARWRPWVGMLMAGWYEQRWQQTGNRQFIALADEAWRQLRVIRMKER